MSNISKRLKIGALQALLVLSLVIFTPSASSSAAGTPSMSPRARLTTTHTA